MDANDDGISLRQRVKDLRVELAVLEERLATAPQDGKWK
jgi:hypothetical protein